MVNDKWLIRSKKGGGMHRLLIIIWMPAIGYSQYFILYFLGFSRNGCTVSVPLFPDKTWKRPRRDQKETWKRPKRDLKERKSEGEKSNRAIWRIFKLFCGASASFPGFIALCAQEWPGRIRAGRQSFPAVRDAGGCAKISRCWYLTFEEWEGVIRS